MHDLRIDRLADLLVRYSLRLRPDDQVLLLGMPLAEPLLNSFYQIALEAGAHVDVQVRLPAQEEIFLKTASDAQLRFLTPMQKLTAEKYDARMVILADPNTRALSSVDPARQAAMADARRPLLQRMMERTAAGEFRWCGFYYPTNAYAQEADMSLEDFTDFVFGACFVDDLDPLARWTELDRQQADLIRWIQDRREIRIVAPDTDLTLAVGGRRWINCSGQLNMPDGEFFTAPLEDSAQGYVRFTYPATALGRMVEGVWLRFEAGEVVEARAEKNEAFLHEMLEVDQGARRLGEFSFGNNPAVTRFSGQTAFDEKIAGTVHLALGAAPPETGGVNRSAIHWDLVCDLRQWGEVYADGQLFMKDGKFVLEV